MKKRGLLLLFPLLLAAIIGCANWKLDHPAPTRADAFFARLIRGADEVEIATFGQRSKVSLRGAELAELRSCLRFQSENGVRTQGYDDLYTFTWKKKGVALSTFDVDFGTSFLNISPSFWQTKVDKNLFNHQLNPRSASRLAAKIRKFGLNESG